jgi:hypothetical protein
MRHAEGMHLTAQHVVTQTEMHPEHIKVNSVICRHTVQEFGDLIIPAPNGVTLNERTGKLEQEVGLEPAGPPILRTVTILPGKVINMGVVPVRLLVERQTAIKLIEIPFQHVLDCPGAEPGDLVQKHDVQIEGFSLSPIRLLEPDLCCLRLHLILKVVLKACIIVAQETILRVDAARPFCG